MQKICLIATTLICIASCEGQRAIWHKSVRADYRQSPGPSQLKWPELEFIDDDLLSLHVDEATTLGSVQTALIDTIDATDGALKKSIQLQVAPGNTTLHVSASSAKHLLVLNGKVLTEFSEDLLRLKQIECPDLPPHITALSVSPDRSVFAATYGNGYAEKSVQDLMDTNTLDVITKFPVPRAFSFLAASPRKLLVGSDYHPNVPSLIDQNGKAYPICRTSIQATFLDATHVLCNELGHIEVFTTAGESLYSHKSLKQHLIMARAGNTTIFAFSQGEYKANYSSLVFKHGSFSKIVADTFVVDWQSRKELLKVHMEWPVSNESEGEQIALAISPSGKKLAITNGREVWLYDSQE